MPTTILVVGGAGYIGTHMVKRLLEEGLMVVTLDDLSTGHRALLPGGDLVVGSLGDARLLDSIFRRYAVAAVMHFAAFAQVGESAADPLRYYRNNVTGTVELLAAMIRGRITCFIFSSSAAVYGEPEAVPIPETHPLQPTNPYGATKQIVENMLKDCDAAHGLKSICLRYFNAAGADPAGGIGERHIPETHLIPLVLRAALDPSQPVSILGSDYPTPDGTAVRDYIHVNDLVEAHMLALRALLDGCGSAVYNLGNSRGYSVKEVIETARSVTGRPIAVKAAARRSGDPAVLVADSSRIRRELDWKPAFQQLETIIQTAWRWHRRQA